MRNPFGVPGWSRGPVVPSSPRLATLALTRTLTLTLTRTLTLTLTPTLTLTLSLTLTLTLSLSLSHTHTSPHTHVCMPLRYSAQRELLTVIIKNTETTTLLDSTHASFVEECVAHSSPLVKEHVRLRLEYVLQVTGTRLKGIVAMVPLIVMSSDIGGLVSTV